ncbi:hypothetical protein F5888DRAFT_86799 [Russula emetica]|nr:hypothetical protein F5888DRAFT_86799 [Russula emetica]
MIDYFERAKSSKLAKTEPHELNLPSKYGLMRHVQDERILDDCPASATNIPPLPLLFSGFGYFHDFVNKAVVKPDTVLDPYLKNEVGLPLDAMCKLQYEQEEQDMTQGGSSLCSESSLRALGGCLYMVSLTDLNLKQPPTGIS